MSNEYRGETVKAFVALKEGDEISEDELVSYCKERMADYKYPRKIELLDELPKTATGRFLRRALRDEARAKRKVELLVRRRGVPGKTASYWITKRYQYP